MNYIRTKDGAIYDLKSKEISSIEQKDCWVNIFYYNREKGQYLEWDDNGGRSMDTIYKTEILKQSENLEELCDRYIGISNNKPMIIKYEFDEYYDEYGDTYTKEELLIEYDIIYGAIYTDKGLIYVAKMDSEGKLVLI